MGLAMRISTICLALFVLAPCVAALSSVPQPHKIDKKIADYVPSHGEIKELPGFRGPLPSRHYGGYISVGGGRDGPRRHLYYYVAESQRDPGGDPIVLWLNGGPGCSSFDGFLYELGPFNFRFADANFTRVELAANPYAWNKVATVVFLDSPAGVGLSYADDASAYTTNDTRTAEDTDAFLRAFFVRYPAYADLDFYIAGESYAGIYVPNAAKAVVDGNRRREERAAARGKRGGADGAAVARGGSNTAAAKTTKTTINLKGYLVGNGCTDAQYDGNAYVPFAAGKSLISQAMHARAREACNGQFWDAEGDGGACGRRLRDVSAELAGLNVYNVLEECHHGPRAPALADKRAAAVLGLGAGAAAEAGAGAKLAEARRHRVEELLSGAAAGPAAARAWPLGGGVHKGRVPTWPQLLQGLGHNPPCTDASEGDVWLNDPAVRAALHAAPIEAAGAPWTVCSDRILYTHDAGSMLAVHRELLAKRGLRALVYSGDHDLAVPHTGSEAWTAEFGFGKRAEWRPWHVGAPRQVAGYVAEYERLTYATVKGAGHMVPQSKPAESLAMFSRFLRGEAL